MWIFTPYSLFSKHWWHQLISVFIDLFLLQKEIRFNLKFSAISGEKQRIELFGFAITNPVNSCKMNMWGMEDCTDISLGIYHTSDRENFENGTIVLYSSALFWYIPSKRYIKIYGRKKQYVLGGSSGIIRAWIQCLLHIVMKKKHFMTRGNIPGFWYWSLTHNFSSFGFLLLKGDIQEFVEKRVVKFHIFK